MQYQNEVYDSVFLLMVNQSIQYIFSKKLDKKTQKQEIEELGFQLGEKVTNNLLNTENINNKINLDKNSTDNYFIFISQYVWDYIFRDKTCQMTKGSDNTTYVLTSGDIRLYNYLVTEKTNQNDPKLDAVLNFISGIIKGALNVFNIECIVIPAVTNYAPHLVKEFAGFPKSQYIFTFNVNVFLDSNEVNTLKE